MHTEGKTRGGAVWEWTLLALVLLAGLMMLRLHLGAMALQGISQHPEVEVAGKAFSLASLTQPGPVLRDFAMMALAMVLLVGVKRLALPRADPVILPCTLLLAMIGLMQILSLAPRLFLKFAMLEEAFLEGGRAAAARALLPHLDKIGIYRHHLAFLFLALGLSGGLLLAYRYAFATVKAVAVFVGRWVTLQWVLLWGLVAATLLFGTDLGTGKVLWLKLGPVHFQSVDACKVFLLWGMASYLHYYLPRMSRNPWRYLLPLLVFTGLSIGLVLAQQDMGGVLFLAGFCLALFIVATQTPAYFLKDASQSDASARKAWQFRVQQLAWVIAAGVIIGAFLAVAYFFLPATRPFSIIHTRIVKFLDPQHNDEQLTMATVAVAAGGLTGTGWGMGDAAMTVAAVQSDFNFVVLAEEMGFFFSALVLLLYGVLFWRLMHLPSPSLNLFLTFVQKGAALLIGLQALIIVGGNLSLIPLTGVTLPFISYGGTSLVLNLVLVVVALVISDDRWDREKVSWS
jgi:cell division protein FtsW (lipid II flippase)